MLLADCVLAQNSYKVISTTNLNVRSAPELKAKVLGVLKPNDIVSVLSISNGWAELLFDGVTGYASSRFLQIVEQDNFTHSVDTSFNVRVVYDVISTSRLNVRSQPSTNSRVLGTLAPGYRIEGGEEHGEWLRFDYEGVKAYTSLKYLKREDVVEQIVREDIKEVVEEAVVEVPIAVEDPIEQKVPNYKKKLNFLNSQSLFRISSLSSNTFDVFLSGRVGIGLSSYNWKNGSVSPTVGVSVDALTQVYCKSLANMYMEASVGYDFVGAAELPMHYLTIAAVPLGYYYDYKKLRFVGGCGAYAGIPLSTMKYVGLSKVDVGLSVSLAVEYNLVSLGIEYNQGFINVATPDVKLNNWSLMAKIACKIISFNK